MYFYLVGENVLQCRNSLALPWCRSAPVVGLFNMIHILKQHGNQATDDDIIIVRIYEYILLWHMYGLQLLFSIIIIMT